jgi:type IV pilus assembly protein PilV
MRPARSVPAGFSLVELLVATVVVCVGLLALVALQLECLRATRSALSRTQAVALTADLADRVRAHPRPAAAYDCGGECEDGDGGDALAVADLASWRSAVRAQLPDGTASVTYAAGTAAGYRIALDWSDGDGSRAVHELEVLVEAVSP